MRAQAFFLILLSLCTTASLILCAETDFELAEEFYRAGKFSQAESLYSRITPDHPNYPLAQLHLGTVYYLTGRPALAEQHFKNYLNFHESAEAYSLLAGAQFNQKEFDRAEESAHKALRLDARYAKAHTVLGMIYTAQHDWTKAEAAYREALGLNRNDADTWFMLGRAYYLRNDFVRAAEAFEAALKTDPHSIRTYENLARTRDLMGDQAAAERLYQEGLRLSRSQKRADVHIHLAYGIFLFRLKRLEESRALLDEATKVAPQEPEAHYELGKVLFRMGRLEAAAREEETALGLGGTDRRVHFLLSRIYTALGDPAAARKYAESAARLPDPKP